MASETYKRIAVLNIEACLLLILYEQPLVINGNKVKVGSPRLRTYLKGTTCVGCGLEAAYFAVEACRPDYKSFHLNLYCLKPDGTEVMMTSDHIHPKSKGGAGSLKNRQPMCFKCNTKKGNKTPENKV